MPVTLQLTANIAPQTCECGHQTCGVILVAPAEAPERSCTHLALPKFLTLKICKGNKIIVFMPLSFGVVCLAA